MRISSRGNEDGYALMDAVISLFIAGIAVIAITACVSMVIRTASVAKARTDQAIERGNDLAERSAATESHRE